MPLGYFSLRCFNPPVNMLIRMGEATPNLSEGYGGFEEVDLERTAAQVVYKGTPAMKLKIEGLLDDYARGNTIEHQMWRIDRISNPSWSGFPILMPVRISGPGLWSEIYNYRWVIEDVDWAEAEMNRAGRRTRQKFTLSLLRLFDRDVQLERCHHPYIRRWRVQEGDSFGSISEEVFGSSHCWRAIRRANSNRDPRRIYVGQNIRIP